MEIPIIPDYIINVLARYSTLIVLNIILAGVIIFLERKNPSATLAWILVLFMLPGVGILLYFFLSQNITKKKVSKLKKEEVEIVELPFTNQREEIIRGNFHLDSSVAKEWKALIMLNQQYGRAYFTQNNDVNIITDGNKKFEMLIWDIENSQDYINMCYYIIKNDHIGRRLIDALTMKARDGVAVRLMIDAMGSRQITKKSLQSFKEAGGKFAFFLPSKLKYINLELNYRNHRKLTVIDGKIGYIGGFNVGREYIGENRKFGNWRDTHLRIMGSAVKDLDFRFILDWRYASKEKKHPLVKYTMAQDIPYGDVAIQIVSCGPDTRNEEIKYGYLKMISSAKRNIFIQTPYFVPDISILESLKSAAMSGVDVRIMIPNKPDHVFVHWATNSYVGELLRASKNVKVYKYKKSGFLHAKTLCVDGEVLSVGSANFDIRSFRLNFEANAFIFSEEKAKEQEVIFLNDINNSVEMTLEAYDKRALIIRFKESISRLLSDIL